MLCGTTHGGITSDYTGIAEKLAPMSASVSSNRPFRQNWTPAGPAARLAAGALVGTLVGTDAGGCTLTPGASRTAAAVAATQPPRLLGTVSVGQEHLPEAVLHVPEEQSAPVLHPRPRAHLDWHAPPQSATWRGAGGHAYAAQSGAGR